MKAAQRDAVLCALLCHATLPLVPARSFLQKQGGSNAKSLEVHKQLHKKELGGTPPCSSSPLYELPLCTKLAPAGVLALLMIKFRNYLTFLSWQVQMFALACFVCVPVLGFSANAFLIYGAGALLLLVLKLQRFCVRAGTAVPREAHLETESGAARYDAVDEALEEGGDPRLSQSVSDNSATGTGPRWADLLSVPDNYLCSLSSVLLIHPVEVRVGAACSVPCERRFLARWYEDKGTNPFNRSVVDLDDPELLQPHRALEREMQEWARRRFKDICKDFEVQEGFQASNLENMVSLVNLLGRLWEILSKDEVDHALQEKVPVMLAHISGLFRAHPGLFNQLVSGSPLKEPAATAVCTLAAADSRFQKAVGEPLLEALGQAFLGPPSLVQQQAPRDLVESLTSRALRCRAAHKVHDAMRVDPSGFQEAGCVQLLTRQLSHSLWTVSGTAAALAASIPLQSSRLLKFFALAKAGRPLTGLLHHENPNLQKVAAMAISRLARGPYPCAEAMASDAARSLVELLQHRNRAVFRACLSALRTLVGQPTACVTEELNPVLRRLHGLRSPRRRQVQVTCHQQ